MTTTVAHRATAAASAPPFGLTAPMRYMLMGAAAKATPSGIQRDRAPDDAARKAQARSAAPTRELAMRMAMMLALPSNSRLGHPTR